MKLTYLDSNSWLIEIDHRRILLDPWLVGELTFGNLPWLFRGKKNNPHPIPENIDLILLSQGLEDHAHPPTLKKLDKQIPVAASPNGAKLAQSLGFGQVVALEHQASYQLGEQVEITAVPGSPIGPTLVENGYIIKGLESQKNIYYEPHGYHSDLLDEFLPIEVIVTPLLNLKLPVVGAVIRGQETALQLCKRLNPKTIISTAAGGDIDFQGLLMSIIKADGTIERFRELLQQNNLETQVIDPQSGTAIELE